MVAAAVSFASLLLAGRAPVSTTFDTELTVEEVVQVAPNWAFVRTNSNGHVTVKAIKQRVPDANHELFVLQKGEDGAWKIARYSFASTNPLPQ